MTKKFGQVVKVWSQYGSFLMKRRRLDAARALLQRSLKVLTSKQDRKYRKEKKIEIDRYQLHSHFTKGWYILLTAAYNIIALYYYYSFNFFEYDA